MAKARAPLSTPEYKEMSRRTLSENQMLPPRCSSVLHRPTKKTFCLHVSVVTTRLTLPGGIRVHTMSDGIKPRPHKGIRGHRCSAAVLAGWRLRFRRCVVPAASERVRDRSKALHCKCFGVGRILFLNPFLRRMSYSGVFAGAADVVPLRRLDAVHAVVLVRHLPRHVDRVHVETVDGVSVPVVWCSVAWHELGKGC